MIRRILTKYPAIAVALAGATTGQAADKYYPGVAILKLYNDIPTVQLSTLEASPKYPNKPDEIRFVDLAEVPTNIAENYGGVIEFLYSPPSTGNWVFAIAADDNADLWISTDETPANLKQVATEPEWNPVRSFGDATRRSGCGDGGGGLPPCQNVTDPIRLESGKRYLVRGRYKEAGGGDNYAVAAKLEAELPFANTDEPIPAARIGVVASDTVAAFGVTAARSYAYIGETVRLSASLYRPPGATATVKWFKNGTEIAGATAATLDYTITAADAGADSTTLKFKAAITGGGVTAETAESNLVAIKKTGPVLSPGFVTAEFFHDISGTAIAGLIESDKFLSNTPDATRVLNSLNTPDGYGENYGARVTGFILPQETGDYRFFIRSDDASQFFLNTTAGGAAPNPSADAPIAEETGCCEAFKEPDDAQAPLFETSAAVRLTAGQRYAFVALIKEGGGGDYLQVAWRKEGDATPAGSLRPLSGPVIGGNAEAGGFTVTLTQQPQSVPSLIEGRRATLSAAATVFPDQNFLFYQWNLNGSPISGANSSSYTTPSNLAIGNHSYTVDAYTVGNRKVTSAPAVVTVVRDTFPPVPKIGVVKKGNTFELGVGFDEPVQAAEASVQANYSVSPGTIQSFRFVEQSGHAVIVVGGVAAGQTVNVTVRNVKDAKGNAIPASGAVASAKLESKFAWVGVGGNEANEQKGSTAFSDDAVALSGSDFDLISGGTAHWNNYDEQTFLYEEITGDFDRVVRVEFQSASSQWARAGLQLREALDEGLTRAQLYSESDNPTGVKISQAFTIRVNPAQGAPNGDGTFVPGNNSYELIHRPQAGARYDGFNSIYNIQGGFGGAPPYPNAWMRLARQGQTIRAWKSENGVDWGNPASITYTDDPATPENELLDAKLFVGVFYAPELGNNDILPQDKLTKSVVAKFREYSAWPRSSGTPGPLTSARSAGGITLTWPAGQSATLQSATSVAGPWTDVAGATSPYNAATTGAGLFYRLKGQ